MLNRRQLLGAAGAAGLGLAASACGTTSTTSGSKTPAKANSSAELKGTINLLTPEFAGAEGKAALEGKVLKGFTDKHPGVKFQVDYTPWDKLNEKLSTQIAGGSPSDVIMFGMGWTQPFAHKKIVAEIDKSAIGADDVVPNLLENASYNGKLYSVPMHLESRPFIYRKDLLGKAGIGEDAMNVETVDQFTSLLKEIKAKTGKTPLDMLASSLRQAWGQMIFAFGGTQFAPDGMSITFDQEPGVKALQWLVDLQKEGLSDFNQRVATGQPGAYQTGKAMIGWQSSGVWPTFAKQAPDLLKDENLGIMLCPGTSADKKVIYQGGTLAALSTRSKNPEAAIAVIEYMMSDYGLTEQVRFTGKVPARKLPPDPELDANKLAAFSSENLKYSVTDGGTPAWMEIRGKMDPVMEAAILGKKSVSDTIAELKKLAEDAIGRVK
ncbi:extracellular solute-binding protein [Aestuariimicrobium kwangyangense]|uniref:extracellular solute-binding protein n=1 Tax=Aestuariimicrobium kwangyangense TaxID=396389 RepID=UPI0003B7A81C|nr:extracellular solute-binding protein [Aestuariimicrobium kwangyangense]